MAENNGDEGDELNPLVDGEYFPQHDISYSNNASNDTAESAVDHDGNDNDNGCRHPLHLLLDAGYGLPRESRPRKEKILAIAKQIANFLQWQLQEQQKQKSDEGLAPVTVIGCEDEEMIKALMDRLEILWKELNHSNNNIISKAKNSPDHDNHDEKISTAITATTSKTLPTHFSFCKHPQHTAALLQHAVYLSPDAPQALNPSRHPPAKVIVGLLIDRRVQVNRSLQRSEQLQLNALRWPMELVHMSSSTLSNSNNDEYHPHEPLNVDTILEALQQWSWNWHKSSSYTNHNHSSTESHDIMVENDTPFLDASLQAFRHHAKRHPARPTHRPF